MPHDGQDIVMTTSPILENLLGLTGAALAPLEELLSTATDTVRSKVSVDGRVSGGLVEEHQSVAHGLAWLATYVEALKEMHGWADRLNAEGKFGEVEQIILQIAFGEYLAQLKGGIPMSQGEILRLSELGVADTLAQPEVVTLVCAGNSQAARSRLVEIMQDQAGSTMFGASGLDEELEMIRDQFRRYALEKVEPFAHEWHLKDELIPMEIIEELETAPREIYCGSIGWFAPDGRAEFNVAIRTLMVDGDQATLNVGGGIVWDSTPASEYEEALWKARFAQIDPKTSS